MTMTTIDALEKILSAFANQERKSLEEIEERLHRSLQRIKDRTREEIENFPAEGEFKPYGLGFFYDGLTTKAFWYEVDETDESKKRRCVYIKVRVFGTKKFLQHCCFSGTHEECMAWMKDEGNVPETCQKFMELVKRIEEEE